MKFDPLTGEVLAKIAKPRRACTRPTGSADAIFFRADDGSVRLDTASLQPQWVSPMRPDCQDGVTVANGLLYWWPSVCDCQLTLYGMTCLGPAGDFDFTPAVAQAERLQKGDGLASSVAALPALLGDWPTFRGDNACSAATLANVVAPSQLLWQFDPRASTAPGLPCTTSPVAVGGLVFVGGTDGVVRALDATTGAVRWRAYTGGAIRVPPTIWEGRAFVGSGDGWVYSYEATTGRLLWRFRAAPAERIMPVYGTLMSTWPVATGVLVDNGTAYFAAGNRQLRRHVRVRGRCADRATQVAQLHLRPSRQGGPHGGERPGSPAAARRQALPGRRDIGVAGGLRGGDGKMPE